MATESQSQYNDVDVLCAHLLPSDAALYARYRRPYSDDRIIVRGSRIVMTEGATGLTLGQLILESKTLPDYFLHFKRVKVDIWFYLYMAAAFHRAGGIAEIGVIVGYSESIGSKYNEETGEYDDYITRTPVYSKGVWDNNNSGWGGMLGVDCDTVEAMAYACGCKVGSRKFRLLADNLARVLVKVGNLQYSPFIGNAHYGKMKGLSYNQCYFYLRGIGRQYQPNSGGGCNMHRALVRENTSEGNRYGRSVSGLRSKEVITLGRVSKVTAAILLHREGMDGQKGLNFELYARWRNMPISEQVMYLPSALAWSWIVKNGGMDAKDAYMAMSVPSVYEGETIAIEGPCGHSSIYNVNHPLVDGRIGNVAYCIHPSWYWLADAAIGIKFVNNDMMRYPFTWRVELVGITNAEHGECYEYLNILNRYADRASFDAAFPIHADVRSWLMEQYGSIARHYDGVLSLLNEFGVSDVNAVHYIEHGYNQWMYATTVQWHYLLANRVCSYFGSNDSGMNALLDFSVDGKAVHYSEAVTIAPEGWTIGLYNSKAYRVYDDFLRLSMPLECLVHEGNVQAYVLSRENGPNGLGTTTIAFMCMEVDGSMVEVSARYDGWSDTDVIRMLRAMMNERIVQMRNSAEATAAIDDIAAGHRAIFVSLADVRKNTSFCWNGVKGFLRIAMPFMYRMMSKHGSWAEAEQDEMYDSVFDVQTDKWSDYRVYLRTLASYVKLSENYPPWSAIRVAMR